MKRALMALCTLAASTGFAAWPTVSGSLGGESQLYTGSRFDLVSENDVMPVLRLSVGTAFEVGPGFLDLDVAFNYGEAGASAHEDAVQTKLRLLGTQLGAAWRYPVSSWFHPYARLGLGWDWGTLTVTRGEAMRQTRSGITGVGLLGVQAVVRMASPNDTGRRPSLVIDVGGGYLVRPDFAFDGLAFDSDGAASGSIPRAKVNMGAMPMHGGVLRASLGVRW